MQTPDSLPIFAFVTIILDMVLNAFLEPLIENTGIVSW